MHIGDIGTSLPPTRWFESVSINDEMMQITHTVVERAILVPDSPLSL